MKLKILLPITIISIGFFTMGAAAQTSDGNTALAKRVEQRQARIKQVLTTAQEKRLKARCKGAQLRIAAAQKVASKHYDEQDKRIETLLAKLTDFAQKQKQAGADTAKLDDALAALSQDAQSVKSGYESYISALNDSAAIDCEQDPAGFKVSLEDAREQFKTLKAARKELRKDLAQELLPILKEFKPKQGV